MCAMPYFNQVQIGKLSCADFVCKTCNRNNCMDEWDDNTVFNTCMAILNLYRCVSLQWGHIFIVHWFFFTLLLIPKLKILSWNLSCSPDTGKRDNSFSTCEVCNSSVKVSVTELIKEGKKTPSDWTPRLKTNLLKTSHQLFNLLNKFSKLLSVSWCLASRLKWMLMRTYVQSSFKRPILNIYFHKLAKNRLI